MTKKYVFLRNDDVRDRLDKELIDLTAICLKHRVPISHAVEPANVSKEVVDWLINVKKKFPREIEIIQHGYDHNKNNPTLKFEFGNTRTFYDQLQSIREGKRLMDLYFGSLWNQVFTFPYGTFNSGTLKALKQEKYKAISSKIEYSTRNQIKNIVGKSLNMDFIFGKKINYHPNTRRKYGFQELSVSANLIKSYKNSTLATHYSLEEIENQINKASKYTNVIGILFHHRFHTDQMSNVEQLIERLKSRDFIFSTIGSLNTFNLRNSVR